MVQSSPPGVRQSLVERRFFQRRDGVLRATDLLSEGVQRILADRDQHELVAAIDEIEPVAVLLSEPFREVDAAVLGVDVHTYELLSKTRWCSGEHNNC